MRTFSCKLSVKVLLLFTVLSLIVWNYIYEVTVIKFFIRLLLTIEILGSHGDEHAPEGCHLLLTIFFELQILNF
jgi:hypothetical protein